MSSSITIRTASTSDLDAVARVWHESASRADGAPRHMPSLLELRARIDTELASGWSLWVAERIAERIGERVAEGLGEDPGIVGMLALRTSEADLDQLFVLPAAQRRGVGTCLIERARQEMPAGFTLRTAAANRGARAFYEKSGLRLLSTGQHPRHAYAVCCYGWQPVNKVNKWSWRG